MAKQTFTTGQVLTAAQMTSLQQTAMGGGDTTAKTASYTLVAADAGTVVAMNSASATTITVNTALFAAGDTVTIQNRGAGVCTITAGTATVATAGSLALAQNEGGILYFTATGASVFYDFVQTSSAAGANWSLLNSGGTALTGAQTITVSSIPTGTDKIMILVEGASSASASSFITIRLNTDTGSNYATLFARWLPTSSYSVNNQTAAGGIGSLATSITLGRLSTSASGTLNGAITITGCNAAGVKAFQSVGAGTPSGASEQETWIGQGYYNSASVISSISVFSTTGNLDAGTVYVYTSA